MLFIVRLVHSAIALFFIGSVLFIYYDTLARIDSPLLVPLVFLLLIEGGVLVLNKGKCPLTPLHNRYGDDKGFFGLFLPPHLAKKAPKFIAAVGFFGLFLHLVTPSIPQSIKGKWSLQKHGCNAALTICAGDQEANLNPEQLMEASTTPLYLYFRIDSLATIDGETAPYRFEGTNLITQRGEYSVSMPLPENNTLILKSPANIYHIYRRL